MFLYGLEHTLQEYLTNGGILTNTAEIASASDRSGGVSVLDDDSTPDEDNTNDGTPVNNEILNGGGDEDDHDFSTVTVQEVFDLALIKQYVSDSGSNDESTTDDVVSMGDTVTYTILIYNQGANAASDIELVDYIPNELTLDTTASVGWTDNSDGTASYTLNGVNLQPGDAQRVAVVFTVNSAPASGLITNTVEIVSHDDDGSGGTAAPIDVDSTPDNTDGNAGVIKESVTIENYNADTVNNDQDDHDIAVIQAAFVSLGNRVWEDTDQDGLLNNGESGIANVELQLLNGDGTDYDQDVITAGTQVYTVTTDASGYYTFTPLAGGTYRVRVTAANFTTGSALEGYSSTADVAGTNIPDGDTDSDDNGPGTGSGLLESGIVTLTLGTEPIGELHLGATDASSDTNYTVDFGFAPEPPSLALEKTLISPANGVAMVGDTLTFQLQITNTGSVAVTELNLVDRYDPTILQYVTASVTPDSQTAGTITWTGNFGASTGSLLPNLPLAPRASFTVTVKFVSIAPTRE
ncbi:MAG: SdrD B-like domain-containing protein [Chloroflexota bacterium]